MPIYNIMLFIFKIPTGVLFVGVSPMGCEPDSWLGKKLKSKILLFNIIKIFSNFTLLIKPLGCSIRFKFFFRAFSTSLSI